MSKSSKSKGYRGEIGLVNKLEELGIPAERDGRPGMKDVFIGPNRIPCEVKVRKGGFKLLYDWLSKNKYLAVRAVSRKEKGQPYLIVMTVDQFAKLWKED